MKMSLDNEDRKLLEELIESRNNTDKKDKSLRNLFDNKENPGFLSLKGLFSITLTILGAIVLATSWWFSVNESIDSFDEKINKHEIEMESIREDLSSLVQTHDTQIDNIKSRILDIEHKLKEFKSSVRNDKRIFNVINDRVISNIQEDINNLKEDIERINENTLNSEMTRKEINYRIEKLEERLNRLENLKKE